jgi:hypothetical protein
MDHFLLQGAVTRRLGEDLPELLSDFSLPEGKPLLGRGLKHVLQYVSGSFVACEAEIERLNALVLKLKRENKKLRAGEHVGAAASIATGGQATTLAAWKASTLRNATADFETAMLKAPNNCDVKVIALAREVLRRLDRESGLAHNNLVNAEIVFALKNFYVQVIVASSPHSAYRPLYPSTHPPLPLPPFFL